MGALLRGAGVVVVGGRLGALPRVCDGAQGLLLLLLLLLPSQGMQPATR